VSKESQNKKQLNKESDKTATNQQRSPSSSQVKLRKLGTQRVRKKTNLRFLILLAVWVIALVIGLLFISGKL
jgi:hypothetical protein